MRTNDFYNIIEFVKRDILDSEIVPLWECKKVFES